MESHYSDVGHLGGRAGALEVFQMGAVWPRGRVVVRVCGATGRGAARVARVWLSREHPIVVRYRPAASSESLSPLISARNTRHRRMAPGVSSLHGPQ